jgi:L-lysine 2,3-aminomutase
VVQQGLAGAQPSRIAVLYAAQPYAKRHGPRKPAMIAAKPVQNLTDLAKHTSAQAEGMAWQAELRDGFDSVTALLEALSLDADTIGAALELAHAIPNSAFALRVPRGFVRRMQPGNPLDPLLLQVLPLDTELAQTPGFGPDPVQDLAHSPLPGLIHKYRSRVLLVTTGACAVHCRYCFRREYPYDAGAISASELANVCRYIQSHPEINEVILSGGDPLSLSNARLRRISDALLVLPQIRRLRLHTRTPIVLPSRVDAGLLNWLKDLSVPVAIVLHSNHAQEWQDPSLQRAASELRRTGCTLLNQAVLLRRVNDSLAAQCDLSEALFAHGVLPYYLNQLDKVSGSAHFYVDDTKALALHAAMHAQLPGFLLPRLVQDRGDRVGKSTFDAGPHAE